MRAPIFRRADIGGCRSVERVLEQESPASREYVVPDVPTGEEGRKTERTVSRPRNVRSAWFAGPTSPELAAFTTGCVRGFLTRPTTRFHIAAVFTGASPHAGVEPVSKRRIQRECWQAEVSVGCSRDGIDLLCPDLIAASGIDPAKRRVAKSSQRASFACR